MDEADYKFSSHLKERMEQRNIKKEWIIETISNPEERIIISEEEIHYFKLIADFLNKCLKVVINPVSKIIVTAYFDRNKTKKLLK